MEEEKDAFYVLRKGDVIGIFKSLSDCQAQVSSSVCDPPVSVYKGYSLPKETEEYLASRGLKNALYSMHAVDAKDDLFGNLVPCPFKQPNGLPFSVDKSLQKISNRKRSTDMVNELVLGIDRRDGGGEEFDHLSMLSANDEWDQDLLSEAVQVMEVIDEAISSRKSSNSQGPSSALPPSSPSAQELLCRFSVRSDEISAQTTEAVEGNLSKPEAWLSDKNEEIGSSSLAVEQSKKHFKPGNSMVEHPSHDRACILEFDGASKGNPGKAGAGAILRAEDGRVISRLRQGLGLATNNVAEYQALILGMKHALKKGFKHIRVQGDSNLVCMQVNGLWQTKNENMANLCKEAKLLKDKFLSFKISHVLREFNSAADEQANLGVGLCNGLVMRYNIDVITLQMDKSRRNVVNLTDCSMQMQLSILIGPCMIKMLNLESIAEETWSLWMLTYSL